MRRTSPSTGSTARAATTSTPTSPACCATRRRPRKSPPPPSSAPTASATASTPSAANRAPGCSGSPATRRWTSYGAAVGRRSWPPSRRTSTASAAEEGAEQSERRLAALRRAASAGAARARADRAQVLRRPRQRRDRLASSGSASRTPAPSCTEPMTKLREACDGSALGDERTGRRARAPCARRRGPGFAAELDERAAAGFPRRSRWPRLSLSLSPGPHVDAPSEAWRSDRRLAVTTIALSIAMVVDRRRRVSGSNLAVERHGSCRRRVQPEAAAPSRIFRGNPYRRRARSSVRRKRQLSLKLQRLSARRSSCRHSQPRRRTLRRDRPRRQAGRGRRSDAQQGLRSGPRLRRHRAATPRPGTAAAREAEAPGSSC